MISPQKNEDILIKWIFGEIIYNKHNGKQITDQNQWKWATNTRFQKIMYNVAENFDIPITRSWYMWGGYIHSSLSEKIGFNTYMKRYANKPELVEKLRIQIKDLGFNTDTIINEIIKQTKYFTSASMNQILPIYYKVKTPSEYVLLYISKQNLNDILEIFSKNNNYKEKKHLYELEDNYQHNYYIYDEESKALLDEDIITSTKNKFYTLVNTAIDKIETYVLEEKIIENHVLSFFKDISNYYKDYIWNPYASIVSQNTLKGPRAIEEKKIMAEKEYKSISFGSSNFDNLTIRLKKENIEPSFKEYKLLNAISPLDKNVKEMLNELLNIYQNEDADHE
jgi:hypothetical protein